jgi:WD40 repeat protein
VSLSLSPPPVRTPTTVYPHPQFDPVFGLLLTGSTDGTVRVWDYSFEKHNCLVRQYRDSTVLAHNRSPHLAGARDARAPFHPVSVLCIHVDPNGGHVATGADDGVVRVFRVRVGDQCWVSQCCSRLLLALAAG